MLKRHSDFWKNTSFEWSKKYFSFILDNIDKNLIWEYISENPNITVDIINDNLDKPWEWEYISKNPNLTIEIINNNPDNPDNPWDWYYICSNKFKKDKISFMERKASFYMIVYRLKKIWLKKYYSPNTEVGIRRLNKSYDSLNLE